MALLENITDPKFWRQHTGSTFTWLQENVLVMDTLAQLAALAVAWLMAFALKRLFAKKLEQFNKKNPFSRMVRENFFSILWLGIAWIFLAIFAQSSFNHQVIKITTSLLTAWVFINCMGMMVKDRAWSKFITITVWTITALNIVDLLDETTQALNNFSFKLGKTSITALSIVEGFLSLAILLWLSTNLSRVLERRVSKLPNLAPSTRVLFGKLFHITFFTIAFLIALNMIGIDLTVFAVFTGALGVGLGFGLQKVVSNFVSGIILLMEKSVKPGDVIAIEDGYGWVQSLGARYVSVLTRDGIEHIIPNEDFITQKVENWSFSDSNLRLKIPIGVSYNCDLDLAISLCIEAANGQDRIKNKTATVCLVKGFGDNAVDLELRFWIDDPSEGCANIQSKVYLSIWHKFKEHGIEIPYPQRDLHIRTSIPLSMGTSEPTKKKA